MATISKIPLMVCLIAGGSATLACAGSRTTVSPSPAPATSPASVVQPREERVPAAAPQHGHTSLVYSAAFSPDGTLIATGSLDDTAKLWDTQTGQLRLTYECGAAVTNLVFTPDGQQLLTQCGDAKLWDLSTSVLVHRFPAPGGPGKVALSTDGALVLTGGDKGSPAAVWHTKTGKQAQKFQGTYRAVALSTDGKLAATGGSPDEVARLWDVTSGELLRTFDGVHQRIVRVAFSPDSSLLLTAGARTQVWDVETGNEKFELDAAHANWAEFSSDGRLIMVADCNDKVNAFEAATGSLTHRFKGGLTQCHERLARSLLTPNNALLLVGTSVYDVATSRALYRVDSPEGALAIAYSPDSKLAVAGIDMTAYAIVWDLTTGKAVHTLRGATEPSRNHRERSGMAN